MPSSFVVQIPGESRPRNFKYNIEENALYTDLGGVMASPNQATNPDMDELVGELRLSQGSGDEIRASLDGVGIQPKPIFQTYWEETFLQREAYRICEQEDISLEAAFERVSVSMEGEPEPEVKQPMESSRQPSTGNEYAEPEPIPVPEPTVTPLAGIIISNQRLLLRMALVMLESGNVDEQQVALIKEELETLDGYEIAI